MAAKKPKKNPPKGAVATAVVVTRDDEKWTVNWKLNQQYADSKRYKNNCVTGQLVQWYLGVKGADPVSKDVETSASASSETKIFKEFKGYASLKSFYPYTKTVKKKTKVCPKLSYVKATVRAFHQDEKGTKRYMSQAKAKGASLNVNVPAKPSVSWSYDPATAKATVTVKSTKETEGTRVWSRTMLNLSIKDQNGNQVKSSGKSGNFRDLNADVEVKNYNSANTEYTRTIDVSSLIGNMQSGKSVLLTATAYAQGPAGDTGKVTQNYKVAMPSPGTIYSIDVSGDVVKVRVTCGTNTDTVQLQRRHGEDGSWEDVPGGTDNSGCSYLYDSVRGAASEPGENLYYRLKSMRHAYAVYSGPTYAEALYTAKPVPKCTANVGIVGATSSISKIGDQAVVTANVVMAWSDSTTNDGCELSWSDRANAWNSTEPPNVAGEITGHDSAKARAAAKYQYSKTYAIPNIDPGVTYYVRMRRYRNVADKEKIKPADPTTIYSGYSATFTITGESAEDDLCGIMEVNKDPSGKRAEVVVGISEDNVNTGTQLSWSDYQNAWTSNREPSQLDAEWDTEPLTGDGTWRKRHTIHLTDLEPGTVYYVKARRYLTAGSRTTYSPWSSLASFTTLSSNFSSDIRCALLSVAPGADGTSATCVIGWDGDHSGCEVTWSEYADAWESTEKPGAYEFDSVDAESQSEDWSHTSTVVVRGLTEGTQYYFRARTYSETGDDRFWSAYSTQMSATPYASPDEVVLTAPDTAVRGEPIECFWTISGELEQKEWHIHPAGHPEIAYASGEGSLLFGTIPADRVFEPTYSLTTDTAIDPSKAYYVRTGSGTSADPYVYAVVEEPDVADVSTYYEMSGFDESPSSISFYVEAGVGGGLTASEPVTVAIADPASCDVCAPATVTSQPATVEVYTDNPASEILATVTSDGITYAAPDGDRDQVEGDVIWTDRVPVQWSETTWADTEKAARLSSDVSAAQARLSEATQAKADADAALAGLTPEDEGYAEAVEAVEDAEAALATATTLLDYAQQAQAGIDPSGTVNKATLTFPAGLALVDGGTYSVSVRTVENVAGLVSEPADAKFKVEWAHQAPFPPEGITLVPDVENRTVTITLVPPDGAEATDVYDVYRKKPTGYERIAAGLGLSDVVTDRYAPFGNGRELDYGICCRTADGDEAFDYYGYEMDVRVLRFDWAGGSVELPWNLEMDDSYAKNFETRAYLDGSVQGYYERDVTLTGTYTTDINRVSDPDQIELVRMLGEYPGSCFCRTRSGDAFQCDAQVKGLKYAYSSAAMPVSIAITAFDLTDDYRVADSDIVRGA